LYWRTASLGLFGQSHCCAFSAAKKFSGTAD